ncbi:GGDEF domain-containing protein [Zestomonas thermotolerans]|uniref:GGDEF domain-containing protein n=1 Tax=Zestomonas thermotolerans TaxID=157784 RepID=UPI0023F2AB5B|nr:GGDEF domain-containing protein [Pseudomonas thermotolerans]
MAPDARLPPSEYLALWREAQDTRTRTRLGAIYYLIGWLLIWLFAATPGSLLLGLAGTLYFALIMALRWLHRLPVQENEANLRLWLDQHWRLLYLSSLGWGVSHAWTLYSPAFSAATPIATLGTLAFSTSMVFNFPMSKRRCMTALLLLYLPGLTVLGLQIHEQQAELVTLAVYLSYLLLVIDRSHREYHSRVALERQLIEQRERFARLSRTDPLTQLGNRLHFNSLFPAMVANGRRQRTPLSLVLLDIDLFKRINDQFGHASGDACLIVFAERMRQVFRRNSDVLLRLGGEEFGVLMPGTSLEQARELAERFRAELASQGFELNGQRLPLTTSLGVGSFNPARDDSAEAFFKRVDGALYRSKADGRNRLTLA